MKHVFGPVPSRRLGLSLGVDPVVPKTCTMDCIYCELGPTTNKTVVRERYVDVDEILAELERHLRTCPVPDFVTLSGSGEPTLNVDLGRLIDGIRGLTDIPVAVLTNGSLMTDPEVRSALARAHVVAPSLDAVSPEVFRSVNRPHPSLDAQEIASALATFNRDYGGELWLETLIVAGVNDSSGEIDLLAETIRTIAPDRVHVNTVVRPPADVSARPVGRERLREIATRLGPCADVIAQPTAHARAAGAGDVEERVRAMAARRPVTVADVSNAFGMSQAAAAKALGDLIDRGVLEVVRHGEKLYYRTPLDRGRP